MNEATKSILRSEATPRYSVAAREARVDAKRFPLTRSAGRAFFEDHDDRFEASLRMIIQGFAAEIGKPATRRKRAP